MDESSRLANGGFSWPTGVRATQQCMFAVPRLTESIHSNGQMMDQCERSLDGRRDP